MRDMDRVWAVAAVLALASVAAVAAPDSPILVRKNDQHLTLDCKGGAAAVDGNENVLVFQNCAKISINGNGNQVDAGVVGALSLLGNDNKVTWTPDADGRKPPVANLGSRNVVSATDRGAAVVPRREQPRSEGSGTVQPRAASPQSPSAVTPARGPRLEGSVAAVAEAALAMTGGETLMVDSEGQRHTYDCHGGSIAVTGDRNDLTLQNCANVSVTGVHNSIDVGGATVLNFTGDDNAVKWRGSAGHDKPTITDTGEGNRFTRADP
jgi:Protein of unknown function (DUF3060)